MLVHGELELSGNDVQNFSWEMFFVNFVASSLTDFRSIAALQSRGVDVRREGADGQSDEHHTLVEMKLSHEPAGGPTAACQNGDETDCTELICCEIRVESHENPGMGGG